MMKILYIAGCVVQGDKLLLVATDEFVLHRTDQLKSHTPPHRLLALPSSFSTVEKVVISLSDMDTKSRYHQQTRTALKHGQREFQSHDTSHRVGCSSSSFSFDVSARLVHACEWIAVDARRRVQGQRSRARNRKLNVPPVLATRST